jgi:nucleoside-diphosphate-sugar epimerase
MRALEPWPTFAMKGDPDVERDFVYIGDVVEVFRRSLAWRGRSEALNLCSGQSVTLRALARAVLDATGSDKTLQFDTEFAPAAVKARPTTADRLKAMFGLSTLTPLSQGLPPTVRWYREALRG